MGILRHIIVAPSFDCSVVLLCLFIAFTQGFLHCVVDNTPLQEQPTSKKQRTRERNSINPTMPNLYSSIHVQYKFTVAAQCRFGDAQQQIKTGVPRCELHYQCDEAFSTVKILRSTREDSISQKQSIEDTRREGASGKMETTKSIMMKGSHL